MQTADEPSHGVQHEPPSEGAALAAWFDDSSASDEVQALRAWVAGLSNQLAQARRERDEAQQALAAAHAESAELRRALAEADAHAPAPLGAAPPPAGESVPTATPAAPPADVEASTSVPTDASERAPATRPGGARRERFLAAAVLLLVIAAVVVMVAASRLIP
ncbi:MAG TPA: hypothetical protein VFE37_07355 [Chloroflexota bacterium]|nr:hypothetical protein [Chloroflexota bacterium]